MRASLAISRFSRDWLRGRTSEGSDTRARWQGCAHPQESSVCLGRSPLSCQDTLQSPKALAQLTPSQVLFALPVVPVGGRTPTAPTSQFISM